MFDLVSTSRMTSPVLRDLFKVLVRTALIRFSTFEFPNTFTLALGSELRYMTLKGLQAVFHILGKKRACCVVRSRLVAPESAMSSFHVSSTFLFLLVSNVVSPRGVLTVNVLAANFQLPPNSFLRAGDYSLAMQEDCDLVLYNGTQPIYRSASTNTNGINCSGLAMQADANLVVYEGSTTVSNALWASGTMVAGPGARKFSYYLLLDANGKLLVCDADGADEAPLPWTKNLFKVGADFKPPGNISTMIDWKPPSLEKVHSFMYVGYFLAEGSTIASVNGRFTVLLKNDCNLQVLDTRAGFRSLVWETTNVTRGRACQLTLQPTGKLVIVVQTSLEVLWASSAEGNTSVQWVLTVNDLDGNLAVVDLWHRETVLWTTFESTTAGLNPATGPGASPSSPVVSTVPPSTETPAESVSTTTVMESVAFRATVGACVGAILLLCVAVFALACHYGQRGRATDQATGELQRRIEDEVPRQDENNSSAWSKSTFSNQDTRTF